MLARTTLFCLAIGLLMPALANADIYNRHSLRGKEAKSLRQAIAAKLNAMPAAQVGRGNGKFYQSKLQGTYSTHVGPVGTSYSVTFQAQPRVKITYNGKKTTVSLGGCAGACSTLRMPAGNYVNPQITISALLRSAPPPPR